MKLAALLLLTLVTIATCWITSSNARPPMREHEETDEERLALKIALEPVPEEQRKLLEVYSLWELGGVLQTVKHMYDQKQASQTEYESQQGCWISRIQGKDFKLSLRASVLRDNPEDDFRKKISRIFFDSTWENSQISEENIAIINQYINATKDKGFENDNGQLAQLISKKLYALFIQEAQDNYATSFSAKEGEQLQSALHEKIEAAVRDIRYTIQNTKIWTTLDQTTTQALGNTISLIQKMQHERHVKIFKQICLLCFMVGVLHYGYQWYKYLATQKFLPQALWIHKLKITPLIS